jgi:hypothetical protein
MPWKTLSSTPPTPPSCRWTVATNSSLLELPSTSARSAEKSEASIWLMRKASLLGGGHPASAAVG